MMDGSYAAPLALALAGAVFAPFCQGLINRTKAVWAGRRGQPLLQVYYDIVKLFRKGAVYSVTTTWVFRAGPVAGLAATLTALLIVPVNGAGAPVSFEGDLILFAYLLGFARFATILAALDTGSAFAGMGASREAFFSALAEIAFMMGLASLAIQSHSLSLSGMLGGAVRLDWSSTALALAALFTVTLAENSRIPFDDPDTHLELTMIHEAMVLDNSGPDFGLIQSAHAVKLWLFAAIIAQIANPFGSLPPSAGAVWTFAMSAALCVMIGMVESTMARLRMVKIPQLLVGAWALSAISLILLAR